MESNGTSRFNRTGSNISAASKRRENAKDQSAAHRTNVKHLRYHLLGLDTVGWRRICNKISSFNFMTCHPESQIVSLYEIPCCTRRVHRETPLQKGKWWIHHSKLTSELQWLVIQMTTAEVPLSSTKSPESHYSPIQPELREPKQTLLI